VAETSIEWTEKTWNPIRGCSVLSAGCTNCYAMRTAHRFSGPGGRYEGLTRARKSLGPVWTGEVRIVPAKIDEPLRWRAPVRIFVNSMSDLFHESIPEAWIDLVWAVMVLAPHHTFQILTKRPHRMRAYLTAPDLYDRVLRAAEVLRRERPKLTGVCVENPRTRPRPWIWLGVSVEDQKTADERIPLLLECPAAVRWVSYEPALGPVDFDDERDWLTPLRLLPAPGAVGGVPVMVSTTSAGVPRHAPLDWIVIGGESGPGARPFDLAWARSTIAQCRTAGTACFVKQLGARPVTDHPMEPGALIDAKTADRKGGDMAEWPEDLRVREYPEVRRVA
jgi:protein gp37